MSPAPADVPEHGLTVRPHWLFVVFFPIRQYAGIALLTLIVWLGLAVWGWSGFRAPLAPGRVILIGSGVVVVRLVWAVLQWATRVYGVETPDDRGPVVFSVVGVLNRTRSEVRADVLRNVVVDKPFFQRLLGLGSIGFATAATSGFEVAWVIVERPGALAARVGSPETSTKESGPSDGE